MALHDTQQHLRQEEEDVERLVEDHGLQNLGRREEEAIEDVVCRCGANMYVGEGGHGQMIRWSDGQMS